MAFNLQKFQEAKFAYSTMDVEVKELKNFFDEGEEPIWTVRGLTGYETAEVNESVEKNRQLLKMIEGLISPNSKDKVAAVKESIGISDKTPDDLVRRYELLTRGSVKPELEKRDAMRLADAHPVIFYDLTTKILQLTGQGKRLGE